jgi:hypothetical protein
VGVTCRGRTVLFLRDWHGGLGRVARHCARSRTRPHVRGTWLIGATHYARREHRISKEGCEGGCEHILWNRCRLLNGKVGFGRGPPAILREPSALLTCDGCRRSITREAPPNPLCGGPVNRARDRVWPGHGSHRARVHHGLGAFQRVTRAPTRFSEQDRVGRDDRAGSQPRTASCITHTVPVTSMMKPDLKCSRSPPSHFQRGQSRAAV